MIGYLLRNGAQILQLIIFVILILSFCSDREVLARRAKWLAGFGIIVLIGWGIFLSVAQYSAWNNSGFGKYLLPPHTPISYFIQYILTNILSVMILGLVMALVNALIVGLIGKVRPQVLDQSDIVITLLCSMLILWPAGIFLLPLTLAITAIQILFSKEPITITFALVVSTFFLMFSGDYWFHLFKLSALFMGKW